MATKKPKKPEPVFEVLFQGSNIYPWKIPLSKVAEAFSAIKRLAAGEITGEEDDEEDESVDETVRLLDVRQGSAVFRFVGPRPESALKHLKAAGRILQHPEEVGDNEYVLRPIKDLGAIAKSLNCSIVLKQSGKDTPSLATIEQASYATLSRSMLITGDTKLSGLIERVGGATEAKCAVRLSTQRKRLLYCKVPDVQVAHKLGELLYQRAILIGTAKWLRNSMRVYAFTIKDVSQTKPGSITEALAEIWEAGVKDWERIENPDEYLEQIRGEE